MASFLDVDGTLRLVRGESKDLELHVVSVSDGVESDFDLSGAVIYFTVKCHVADDTNTLQKTSALVSEIEIDAIPTTGKATIYLKSSDTTSLAQGSYVFDIVVVSGDDRHVVVGPVPLIVSRGVTQL